MKITNIETVRLTSRPTLIWVRVHTDEGLIGLGESWFGCAAIEADVHERIAPPLLGRDPSRIPARPPPPKRGAHPGPRALCRLLRHRGGDPRRLGPRRRPLGPRRTGCRQAPL